MTTVEARKLLENKEDFVFLKRFEYSLAAVLERYPDGCPDRIVAAALLLTEDDVEELYQRTIIKLRNIMGVRSDLL